MRLQAVIEDLEREVASINATMRKRVEARRYKAIPFDNRDAGDVITRRVLITVINALKKVEP